MEQSFIQYAPLLIVVVAYLYQNNVFVKPVDLEKKHREILKDAEDKFATLQMVNDLKENFREMKEKIDKIYEHIINKEG